MQPAIKNLAINVYFKNDLRETIVIYLISFVLDKFSLIINSFCIKIIVMSIVVFLLERFKFFIKGEVVIIIFNLQCVYLQHVPLEINEQEIGFGLRSFFILLMLDKLLIYRSLT